jgi:hypothetical protein
MRRRLGFREVVLLSVFGVVLPLVAPTDAEAIHPARGFRLS